MNNDINKLIEDRYKYGFTTDIESESIPPGLNEDVIKAISAKKMSQNLCWIGD